MNSRIREIRTALGLTQREFAKKIGLQHNAISVMERTNTKIPEYYILAICFRFGASETWLCTGEGEMFAKGGARKSGLPVQELTSSLMNTRIREIRQALAINQSEFGEKIDLKQNAVSLMEKPNGRIKEQNIIAICTQFHVNEVWLRTGEGEMFSLEEPLEDPKKKRLVSLFQKLTPPFQDRLLSDAAGLLKLQTQLSETKEES